MVRSHTATVAIRDLQELDFYDIARQCVCIVVAARTQDTRCRTMRNIFPSQLVSGFSLLEESRARGDRFARLEICNLPTRHIRARSRPEVLIVTSRKSVTAVPLTRLLLIW